MKPTLLGMTQDILSAMSSDEVNSISDTTESLQVATTIKNKYLDIVARNGAPEHEQLIQLTPSTDPTRPVLMYIPDGVKSIRWIKYFDHDTTSDYRPGYNWVTILPNDQFIDYTGNYNSTDSYISSFTFEDTSNAFNGSYTFYYRNDTRPRFCTILSNLYVIFDAYNATLENTLEASNTMCSGTVFPIFRMEDNFVPDLGEEQFPLLLNEAKALCFYELKQMPHAKAEQEIKRQWTSVQKNKSMNKETAFDLLPNFGKPGNLWSRTKPFTR